MQQTNKSRTIMATKNVVWAYANMLATTLLKFFVRWAFIKTIGATFLGINGLYTSILGVLSLTELGIGSAMNYSLYKPVAENDKEKIKSLMHLYKKAYRAIALIISALGLAIIPFLKFFIKGAEDVDHVTLYYLFFLFNTVSSYFVSYKYGLVYADQKNYVINNIHTISTIISGVFQAISLFFCNSFLVYLVVQILFQLFEKIYAYFYVDNKYPFLKEKNAVPLLPEEKKKLFNNVRALIIHKFGYVAVNQTDNLIISSFISVTLTGLISNYTLITGTVEQFLFVVFSNVTGSLGNLCATENKKRQYEIYRIYDYICFWLFGFSAIAYASLIQPFTKLMWGADYVVDFGTVLLIIINTYIVGQRTPLENMKTARGIFAADKYLAFLQAVVNLITSIIFVKIFGLIGVFMGTIVSGIIPTIFRPLLVYKSMFDKTVFDYYYIHLIHFLEISVIGGITYFVNYFVMLKLNVFTFAAACFVTAVLPNLIIWLITRKTNEFLYIKNTVLGIIKHKKNV